MTIFNFTGEYRSLRRVLRDTLMDFFIVFDKQNVFVNYLLYLAHWYLRSPNKAGPNLRGLYKWVIWFWGCLPKDTFLSCLDSALQLLNIFFQTVHASTQYFNVWDQKANFDGK